MAVGRSGADEDGLYRADAPEPGPEGRDLPWWRLLLPAVAFAGCQMSWAVQIG